MPHRVLILQIVLGAVFAFSSCSVFKFAKIYTSSEKPRGSLYGDIYRKDSTSYRIGKLNDNWKRVKIDYGDLFFTNNSNTSAITVNSTCDPKKVNYSLSALSGTLLVGIKGKKLRDREIMTVDGEEALFSVYDAEFEGDRLRIATTVLKKRLCIYDFSYSNIDDQFNLFLKDFVEFISGFTVLE